LLVKIEVKAMQILHAITKTDSGYTLKVWEPAELTQDRVRPFLWEINLSAATAEAFELVLEQINVLHKSHSENPEIVPSPSPDLTKIDLGRGFGEVLESGECTTQWLCT
jgi:hypothetical protein